MVTQNGVTATISVNGLLTIVASKTASGQIPIKVAASSQADPSIKATSIMSLTASQPGKPVPFNFDAKTGTGMINVSIGKTGVLIFSGHVSNRNVLFINSTDGGEVVRTISGNFTVAVHASDFESKSKTVRSFSVFTPENIDNLTITLMGGGRLNSQPEALRVSNSYDDWARRLYFNLPTHITFGVVVGFTVLSALTLSSGFTIGTQKYNTVTDCSMSPAVQGWHHFQVVIPIVNGGTQMDSFLRNVDSDDCRNVVCMVTQ